MLNLTVEVKLGISFFWFFFFSFWYISTIKYLSLWRITCIFFVGAALVWTIIQVPIMVIYSAQHGQGTICASNYSGKNQTIDVQDYFADPVNFGQISTNIVGSGFQTTATTC